MNVWEVMVVAVTVVWFVLVIIYFLVLQHFTSEQ